MPLYFETARLAVRPYLASDTEGLFRVMSDARVHIYTKDKGCPWDMQRAGAYIQYMMGKGFKALDCFHGAVIEKSTGQLIGLCGLNPYKPGEPEIEWKLGVPYWGKGYGTELGRQMLKGAFAVMGVKGAYGMAQPGHMASRRVLEKIGMGYIGDRVFHGQQSSFYYIANGGPGPAGAAAEG